MAFCVDQRKLVHFINFFMLNFKYVHLVYLAIDYWVDDGSCIWDQFDAILQKCYGKDYRKYFEMISVRAWARSSMLMIHCSWIIA